MKYFDAPKHDYTKELLASHTTARPIWKGRKKEK
jgi:Oligopeptide/dipeptide transporter, C-terminal region.